jgi:hypothetical protein
MQHKVTIVALTKFHDVWEAFQRNIQQFVPAEVDRVVVVDGDACKPRLPWTVVPGPYKFSMAGNYNVGMRQAARDSDLLLLNDDITFITRNPVEQLQVLAYSDPKIGMVSARVAVGRVGNPLQEHPREDRPLTYVKTAGNGAAAYIKREIINVIGYMDDYFCEAYGAEDADYTWRINMAGYRVGISRDVHVKHGYGANPRNGGTHSATSLRTLGEKIQVHNSRGMERFKEKWGHFDVHGEWE